MAGTGFEEKKIAAFFSSIDTSTDPTTRHTHARVRWARPYVHLLLCVCFSWAQWRRRLSSPREGLVVYSCIIS